MRFGVTLYAAKVAVAVAMIVIAGACSHPAPPSAQPVPRMEEDEFAARAAALQKTCELAALYVGRDDARAASLLEQAKTEALEAVRGAPDPWRGVIFARAYERLDRAAYTLRGAGDYAPPLTASAAEIIRQDLVAVAADLAPVASGYYDKLARRYEPPRRPGVVWGPRPPEAGDRTPTAPAPAPTEERPSPSPSAETALPPPLTPTDTP